MLDGAANKNELGILLLVGLAMFALVAILGLLLVELVMWRFRPVRTPLWLAAAFVLFSAIFLGIPALLIVWLNPAAAATMVDWDLLEWLAIVLGGAMLWWSYLPAVRPSYARVFE